MTSKDLKNIKVAKSYWLMVKLLGISVHISLYYGVFNIKVNHLMQHTTQRIIQRIRDEIRFYCEQGIWSISEDHVASWLSNFKDDSNQYHMAVLILDNILFRTNDMVKAAYRQFFASKLLKEVNKLLPRQLSVNAFFSALIDGNSADAQMLKQYFRLLEVNTSEPGESGTNLYRLLNSDLIHPAFHIQSDINSLDESYLLLAIDEFMGHGTQSSSFFKRVYSESFSDRSAEIEACNNIIYAPAIAMRQGVDCFSQDPELGRIKVLPIEVLNDDFNFFYGNDSDPFSKNPGWTVREAKDIYSDIKRHHGIGLSAWFGRSRAGLPLIFEMGTPNQSLGIIHHKQANNWHHLHSRRNA